MRSPATLRRKAIPGRDRQQGVVLIIALILLMVLSMLAAGTLRNSGSSTQVTNNTRTQALAMQAAEAALRNCEQAVFNFKNGVAAGVGVVTPLAPAVAPAAGVPYQWQTMSNWDGIGTAANVTILTSADMNDAGTLYKRFPECMAQYMQAGNVQRAIVTARGFGPEVPAVDANRVAPNGAEVWLQSIVNMP
ncbi:MAG TPA: PilX N-terminal domain-containing pilus assembly protein [Rhodoferax sp.]|nr:PilX N-terminal domain-containing pilus assembly protein [Rhodoferax sp.]